jgi:prepilin-type N-terminal cleavage/methylation domain-containing protein
MMRRTAPSFRARRPCGFTLIEMLAVLGFTAVLMLFAADFYLEITRVSESATERTRVSRRATALLDRIARDLEATVLVKKPPEVDPLFHPWVFLAEDRSGAEGAEHLKFTTRSRLPRATALHESDHEVVAYVLREADAGGLELLRWSSPRLPEELDRSFPTSEVEGALLFADDLVSFGVRFLDEASEWKSEWDSSTLADSSALPLAAEISLAILPEEGPLAEKEPELYSRRVLMPVRPLDLEALLDSGPEEEEETGCATGMTVGACVAANLAEFDALRAVDPNLATEIDEVLNECYADHPELFADIEEKDCE